MSRVIEPWSGIAARRPIQWFVKIVYITRIYYYYFYSYLFTKFRRTCIYALDRLGTLLSLSRVLASISLGCRQVKIRRNIISGWDCRSCRRFVPRKYKEFGSGLTKSMGVCVCVLYSMCSVQWTRWTYIRRFPEDESRDGRKKKKLSRITYDRELTTSSLPRMNNQEIIRNQLVTIGQRHRGVKRKKKKNGVRPLALLLSIIVKVVTDFSCWMTPFIMFETLAISFHLLARERERFPRKSLFCYLRSPIVNM